VDAGDYRMKLVQIEIRHFRGIEFCHWQPSYGANCLIGPGDSTKTTILDAIELALNPRQSKILEDADFYDGDVRKPIEIIATLTGLPTEDYPEDEHVGLFFPR
jgi:putative ATP-dependent endonuclease of OLD family